MEWTVPGIGDCTIKVTESAYDEAKKKGKYQRLTFMVVSICPLDGFCLLLSLRTEVIVTSPRRMGWHNPDCKCSKK